MSDIAQFVDAEWEKVIPVLMEYVKVPCISPLMDPEWETNGLLDKSMAILISCISEQKIKGLTYNLYKDEGKSPFLVCIIEPEVLTGKTVMLYGHQDKQPGLEGWKDGLGPYAPKRVNGRLYGRGFVDDGYVIPLLGIASRAMHKFGLKHDRYVITIESSEESGSCHLEYYLDKLKDVIGKPDLVVCLDGPGFPNAFGGLTSLRGCLDIDITVRTLKDGIHSGEGGCLQSSTRIFRQLLDRIEDSKTGSVLVPELQYQVTEQEKKDTRSYIEKIGIDEYLSQFPFVEGTQIDTDIDSVVELCLKNTYQATVSYIGTNGIPSIEKGGHTVYPYRQERLSIRLPPNVNDMKAFEALKRVIEANPPYNCQVSVDHVASCNGWKSNVVSPEMRQLYDKASKSGFNNPCVLFGGVGTIPLMGILQKKFEDTDLLVAGALLGDSNAHTVDECLNIDYVKKLTVSIITLLNEYHKM